jgi:hypothetical protein
MACNLQEQSSSLILLELQTLKAKCHFSLAAATSQFIILLPEAVTNREEVPAPLLIHVPYIRLLTGVLRVWFVDKMHQEEPVVKRLFSKRT